MYEIENLEKGLESRSLLMELYASKKSKRREYSAQGGSPHFSIFNPVKSNHSNLK